MLRYLRHCLEFLVFFAINSTSQVLAWNTVFEVTYAVTIKSLDHWYYLATIYGARLISHYFVRVFCGCCSVSVR